MTTQDTPFVTRDELAARLAELELRIVERINQMEIRLTQRIADSHTAQLRYIQGLYAAVILGVAILVAARVFS